MRNNVQQWASMSNNAGEYADSPLPSLPFIAPEQWEPMFNNAGEYADSIIRDAIDIGTKSVLDR
jgi:hypothetical protein